MTSHEAAQLIDAAHKAYRAALDTDHEGEALKDLHAVVRHVRRTQETQQLDAFMRRHGVRP
jgi:hypothetical protein